MDSIEKEANSLELREADSKNDSGNQGDEKNLPFSECCPCDGHHNTNQDGFENSFQHHQHHHNHHHQNLDFNNLYVNKPNKFSIKSNYEIDDSLELLGIKYKQYVDETQMPLIMNLITKDLSEPYSIYTYRYFIHNWPYLCFLVSLVFS